MERPRKPIAGLKPGDLTAHVIIRVKFRVRVGMWMLPCAGGCGTMFWVDDSFEDKIAWCPICFPIWAYPNWEERLQ